jgi:hypothetical protein
MRKPSTWPAKPNPPKIEHKAISRELNEILTVSANPTHEMFFQTAKHDVLPIAL